MANDLMQVTGSMKSNSNKIFNDVSEQKRFYKYGMAVYANNNALVKLDEQQIQSCILQMFLREADPTNGEAYIIAYAGRYGTQAQVQTGYKYAIKKLWQTDELKSWPTSTALYEGDLKNFNPQTREVEYEVPKITSFEEQKARRDKKLVGWVVRFEMKDNEQVIEKFYFDEEILEHLEKYSQGYQSFKKNGKNAKGIFVTNMLDMKRKTALMRTYTEFLPKTTKINKAINDINALNSATYNEISKTAKPIYLDNPQNAIEVKPNVAKKQLSEEETIAPKNIIVQVVFDYIKTIKDKDEQKTTQAKLYKFAKTHSENMGLEFTKWYDMSWKVIYAIYKNLESKKGYKIEIEWPEFLGVEKATEIKADDDGVIIQEESNVVSENEADEIFKELENGSE